MLKRPFRHLRTKLLASIVAVVFLLTAAVLALVQARMRLENAKIGGDAVRINKPFSTEALAQKISEALRGGAAASPKSFGASSV